MIHLTTQFYQARSEPAEYAGGGVGFPVGEYGEIRQAAEYG